AFHLVDVTVMDDDEIMHHRRLGALTLLMKHSRSRDLMLQMDRLVQLIQDSLNEELAQVLFHYLLNGSEHVTVTFLQTLAQRLPQHEDNIMTLAERIEQKGIAKGIEQGKLEGKLETARNMLNAGMDRQAVLQMTGLSNDQLNMLKH
ncbi:Rpn family recombination-promoting nuclease/putative transposase, partial [Escherichia coli]